MKIHLQRATVLCSCLQSIIDCLPIEGTHKAKMSVLLLVSCRGGGDPSHVELKNPDVSSRRPYKKRVRGKSNRLQVHVWSLYSDFFYYKRYFKLDKFIICGIAVIL